MGRRRSHTKSQFGCDRCKRRRVKCDEKHPACTSCASRREECHYSMISQQASFRTCTNTDLIVTPAASASPTAASAVCHVIARDESALSTRRQEFKLMHFWFIKTSQSFSSDLTEVFRNDVVKAALEYEYLSDFIMALSSLHIAAEASDPVVMATYVGIALRYQNTAFPPFRTALSTITESNCTPIFFSSILSMACSVVAPYLISKTKTPASPQIGCVLSLYHFIDGTTSVVNSSRQWLLQGPFGAILKARNKFRERSNEEAVIAGKQLRHLNYVVITPNQPDLYHMYENAICRMEESFEGNMGITWLYSAGKDFANELQKEAPIALVILMHWGVLLCKSNTMWWATFLGRRLAGEVCEILVGHGSQFNEERAWAKQELESL